MAAGEPGARDLASCEHVQQKLPCHSPIASLSQKNCISWALEYHTLILFSLKEPLWNTSVYFSLWFLNSPVNPSPKIMSEGEGPGGGQNGRGTYQKQILLGAIHGSTWQYRPFTLFPKDATPNLETVNGRVLLPRCSILVAGSLPEGQALLVQRFQ